MTHQLRNLNPDAPHDPARCRVLWVGHAMGNVVLSGAYYADAWVGLMTPDAARRYAEEILRAADAAEPSIEGNRNASGI